MKLARQAYLEADTELDPEEHVDIDITELLAKAAAAGYTEEEAIVAILNVAKYQSFLHGWQPNSAGDPDL